MKAYYVTHPDWPGQPSVVRAERPSKARQHYFNSARDAGFSMTYTEIRARRAPLYDDHAIKPGQVVDPAAWRLGRPK